MKCLVLVEIAEPLPTGDDVAHAPDDGVEAGAIACRRKRCGTAHPFHLKGAADHETLLVDNSFQYIRRREDGQADRQGRDTA